MELMHRTASFRLRVAVDFHKPLIRHGCLRQSTRGLARPPWWDKPEKPMDEAQTEFERTARQRSRICEHLNAAATASPDACSCSVLPDDRSGRGEEAVPRASGAAGRGCGVRTARGRAMERTDRPAPLPLPPPGRSASALRHRRSRRALAGLPAVLLRGPVAAVPRRLHRRDGPGAFLTWNCPCRATSDDGHGRPRDDRSPPQAGTCDGHSTPGDPGRRAPARAAPGAAGGFGGRLGPTVGAADRRGGGGGSRLRPTLASASVR